MLDEEEEGCLWIGWMLERGGDSNLKDLRGSRIKQVRAEQWGKSGEKSGGKSGG